MADNGVVVETPQISVIMCVHDGLTAFRRAADSILAQTLEAFEFIIVNDACDADAGRLFAEYAAADARIVLLSNDEPRGLARSLNRALAIARGVYVACQDAHGCSRPERLATQAEYLDRYADVGLLGAGCSICHDTGGREDAAAVPLTDTEIRWRMLFRNAFCHSSVMLRRSCLPGLIGGYDGTLRSAEDYELWGRLLRTTRGANLKIPLGECGQRAVPVRTPPAQQQAALRIAARHIAESCPRVVLTLGEVAALCRWFARPPDRFSSGDIRLGYVLLSLLDAFERRTDLDRAALTSLCDDWRRRVRAALPAVPSAAAHCLSTWRKQR